MNSFAALMFTVVAWIAPASTPFLDLPLDAALKRAGDEKKYVVVYFHDPKKSQCQTYDELTWSDDRVRQWLAENSIAIRGDADLQRRLDVRMIPTVVVLDADGRQRAAIMGFRDPETLLSELQSRLSASDTVGLARTLATENANSSAALLLYAHTLEESGHVDEAVKQYAKCLNNVMSNDTGFGGMQLVALEDVGRLADEHPDARKLLLDTRNASRDRLLTDKARRSDPAILAAANTWLHDLDSTLDTYRRLSPQHPESLMTSLLRENAVDSARKLRRYDRIADLIDPLAHARRAVDQYCSDMQRPVPDGVSATDVRKMTHDAFVKRMVHFYEMLVGVEAYTDAESVASLLLSEDDSAETLCALASAALRSQKPTIANAEQARRSLQRAKSLDPQTVMTLVEISVLLGHEDEAKRVATQYQSQIKDATSRQRLEEVLALP